MKFYFPDSQDQIDPSFDLLSEERSLYRVRQRDDRYAHEVLAEPPFDGVLVSKTIVDGPAHGAGKYTLAQRHRLYRVGVREFFRLQGARRRLQAMGDCGAFSYVQAEEPPYTPDEVIDFYDGCGFDAGLSVDHVILAYSTEPDHPEREHWQARQDVTIELAAEFWRRVWARRVAFEPIGVAQGWDGASYATAVRQLQRIGFRRIALGGMVPLKTPEILECLAAVDGVRRSETQLHLLGVTRCEHVEAFSGFGVTSFDSTSPFRQSFKDDRDNYYAVDRTYTALRVPQVDANPKLKASIRAGRVDQRLALDLEDRCLRTLRRFDAGKASVRKTLDALRAYEALYGERDHSSAYEETLEARPWKTCMCGICAAVGVDIVVFRGAERNKRRGFHNLFVFNRRLQRQLAGSKVS